MGRNVRSSHIMIAIIGFALISEQEALPTSGRLNDQSLRVGIV